MSETRVGERHRVHKISVPGIGPVLFVMLLADASCGVSDRRPKCEDLAFEEYSEELFDRGEFRELYELSIPCAEAGDPEVQFGMGILIGSEQAEEFLEMEQKERESEAVKWLKRAAMSGHQEAISLIADLYSDGLLGLPRSEELEKCWRSVGIDRENLRSCEMKEEELLNQEVGAEDRE